MTPELSRLLRVHELGTAVRTVDIEAKPAERVALARRFDLIELAALNATLTARKDAGGVRIGGRVVASGFQACGLSGAPVNFAIDEPVDLRFATVATVGGEDVELSDADLDTIDLDGDTIDLGEAVAQSLGLALDPYPRAPDAELPPVVIPEDKVVPLKRANPFDVLKRD